MIALFFKVHSKTKVFKNWFKIYGSVKCVISNVWILPGDGVSTGKVWCQRSTLFSLTFGFYDAKGNKVLLGLAQTQF